MYKTLIHRGFFSQTTQIVCHLSYHIEHFSQITLFEILRLTSQIRHIIVSLTLADSLCFSLLTWTCSNVLFTVEGMCIGSTIWNGPHNVCTPEFRSLFFLKLLNTCALVNSMTSQQEQTKAHVAPHVTVDGPQIECHIMLLCWTTTPMIQLAALGKPSGIKEVKKVVMKDQADEKNPFWLSSPRGPSLPSSPLSPSSSPNPSSMTRSCG